MLRGPRFGRLLSTLILALALLAQILFFVYSAATGLHIPVPNPAPSGYGSAPGSGSPGVYEIQWREEMQRP